MNNSTLSLRQNGDSFEREWADVVLKDFPAYEDFWRKHVVPLTYREDEPQNRFLRFGIAQELVDLADTAYATFYHLAHCHAWRRYAPTERLRKFPRATEILYCFFSHATSGHDALLGFAEAVNSVLRKYYEQKAFEFHPENADSREHIYPERLAKCRPHLKLADYHRLFNRLESYRNLLVHRRPVFIQNKYMPRQEFVEECAGLAAIVKLAENEEDVKARYEPADRRLKALAKELGQVFNPIWISATKQLDGIRNGAYRKDQRAPTKLVRRSDIDKVRNLS